MGIEGAPVDAVRDEDVAAGGGAALGARGVAAVDPRAGEDEKEASGSPLWTLQRGKIRPRNAAEAVCAVVVLPQGLVVRRRGLKTVTGRTGRKRGLTGLVSKTTTQLVRPPQKALKEENY